MLLIAVIIVFVALLVYEAGPLVRQECWGELLVMGLLWILTFGLSILMILGVEVLNPVNALVRAAQLLPSVRDFLLPGIDLFP